MRKRISRAFQAKVEMSIDVHFLSAMNDGDCPLDFSIEWIRGPSKLETATYSVVEGNVVEMSEMFTKDSTTFFLAGKSLQPKMC